MTVTVTDFATSLRIDREFDAIIGILDAREKHKFGEALSKIPNRKMFWFDDSVAPFNDAPKESDVQAIVDHINQNDLTSLSKKVLIHCFAGISRSTATAIGLLVMRGWTPEQAFNHIQSQRRVMWPNEDVIKHFDTILKLNNELTSFHRHWKDNLSTSCGGLIGLATGNPEKL